MQILINIDVPDLNDAIRFYSEGLGLRVARRFGEFGVEMVGGSSNVYLLVKSEGSSAYSRDGAPLRSYDRHWTPVHVDFVSVDVASSVKRARDAGAILEQPVAAHDWGSLAVLSDPFGNGFCIIQFTDRGYDAIAT